MPRHSSLLIAAMTAALAMPSAGSAEVLSMPFHGGHDRGPDPRVGAPGSSLRRLRTRDGHRPAGSKLARKAARGLIGINRIR